jgi:RNA-directed DNA polymerase
MAPCKEVKRTVPKLATKNFKDRVRKKTKRSGERSMQQVIGDLRSCLLGRKACFGMAQTSRKFRRRQEWLCHRLRALQLKHWRRRRTINDELRKMGANREQAARMAANSTRL